MTRPGKRVRNFSPYRLLTEKRYLDINAFTYGEYKIVFFYGSKISIFTLGEYNTLASEFVCR